MTDKNTADKHAIDNNVAQGIAAYIDYLNQLRVSTLMDTLRQILNNETGQLKDLAERQANALRNLDLANQNVMNIVNSGRGGENGMHGFIADSRRRESLTPDEHLKGWKNQQLRLIIMVLLIC